MKSNIPHNQRKSYRKWALPGQHDGAHWTPAQQAQHEADRMWLVHRAQAIGVPRLLKGGSVPAAIIQRIAKGRTLPKASRLDCGKVVHDSGYGPRRGAFREEAERNAKTAQWKEKMLSGL